VGDARTVNCKKKTSSAKSLAWYLLAPLSTYADLLGSLRWIGVWVARTRQHQHGVMDRTRRHTTNSKKNT